MFAHRSVDDRVGPEAAEALIHEQVASEWECIELLEKIESLLALVFAERTIASNVSTASFTASRTSSSNTSPDLWFCVCLDRNSYGSVDKLQMIDVSETCRLVADAAQGL